MSGSLTVDDFPEYFGEVHRRLKPDRSERLLQPFTWQTRLARQVWDQGTWPGVVDIPTGAGKTSVVLIAAFLLALDAGVLVEQRKMPRRIAMVVDRRVIVDQAYLEARALLEALKGQRDPGTVLGAVANALRSLWGGPEDAQPMRADRLRGGIVRDESWARRPDRPAILVSTVDQIGSRLLFRGYGVSPPMRPIHAGLMSNDTLFFLDEVHLSRPFAETLRRLRDRYQKWHALATMRPTSKWQVSELSATPRQGRPGDDTRPDERFFLDPEKDDLSPVTSPVLHRRLHASKAASLELVKVSNTDREKADKAFAKRCAQRTMEMLGKHVTTAAVVVNRVDTARRIYAELETTAAERDVGVVLVTGRMRDVDRTEVMKRLNGRLRTGRDRTQSTPLIVVATQCIEAGADFDFDGLVTECASLDALQQRMGRLDRDGELTANGTPALALILARSSDVDSQKDDPVYGASLRTTWEWLNRDRGGEPLDFGWVAWQRQAPSADELHDLSAPSPPAPVLLPTHLDLWVQTEPEPIADPDVAMWLHGIKRESSDVQIVWREDVTRELLDAATSSSPDESDFLQGAVPTMVSGGAAETEEGIDYLQCLRDLLAFRPPASSEALSVPISAARSWLTGSTGGESSFVEEVADVDGTETVETPPPHEEMRRGAVAIWRGDETTVVSHPRELFPGAVLVVPIGYGGLRTVPFEDCEYGWWDPTSEEPVRDAGDGAQLRQRNMAVLRLMRGNPLVSAAGDMPLPDESEGELPSTLVEDWISGIDTSGIDDSEVSKVVQAMTDPDSKVVPVVLRSKGVAGGIDLSLPWFGVSRRLPPWDDLDEEDRLLTLDFEPESSSFVDSTDVVRLDDHLHGVEDCARLFAEHCGLPESVVSDIALAGRLHDLGKVDPRFQSMLRGGRDRLDSGELLAKSNIAASDRARRRRAQWLSGYPRGARHELLSLALITGNSSVAEEAKDWDLVCHLVSSHHGYCRPFAPYAPDHSPREVEVKSDPWTFTARTDHGLERIDSGVADRFWCLVHKYGWFRLAWFEAILRLADHRRSELEQEQQERQQSGNRRSKST